MGAATMNETERIARILCKAEGYNPDAGISGNRKTWEINAHQGQALAEQGLTIVPTTPTPKMLEDVGTMEGFEVDAFEGDCDRPHIEWWQAMIAAREE